MQIPAELCCKGHRGARRVLLQNDCGVTQLRFDSLVGVSGCIIKILARSTEDRSASLGFLVLVLAAGLAALLRHGRCVWPPASSGRAAGDGGHRDAQSQLGQSKCGGFAGNRAMGWRGLNSTGQ